MGFDKGDNISKNHLSTTSPLAVTKARNFERGSSITVAGSQPGTRTPRLRYALLLQPLCSTRCLPPPSGGPASPSEVGSRAPHLIEPAALPRALVQRTRCRAGSPPHRHLHTALRSPRRADLSRALSSTVRCRAGSRATGTVDSRVVVSSIFSK